MLFMVLYTFDMKVEDFQSWAKIGPFALEETVSRDFRLNVFFAYNILLGAPHEQVK